MGYLNNGGLGTDAEILTGWKHELTLAGRSYVWTEPKRRQGRAMLQEVLPLAERLNDGDPVAALEVVDEMLDFFYRHHAKMKLDKDVLDEATEREIADAFKGLMEKIVLPFKAQGVAPPT